MMMLKVYHTAITKFATVAPSNAGASAIFKLLQARPALLVKRIQPPAAAAPAAAPAAAGSAANDSSNDSSHRRRIEGGNNDINSLVIQKRRRV
jgi:hypothetical protein